MEKGAIKKRRHVMPENSCHEKENRNLGNSTNSTANNRVLRKISARIGARAEKLKITNEQSTVITQTNRSLTDSLDFKVNNFFLKNFVFYIQYIRWKNEKEFFLGSIKYD